MVDASLWGGNASNAEDGKDADGNETKPEVITNSNVVQSDDKGYHLDLVSYPSEFNEYMNLASQTRYTLAVDNENFKEIREIQLASTFKRK